MTSVSDLRKPAAGAPTCGAWAERIRAELTGNILPFWTRQAVDHVNGGFYGAVTNDLQVRNDVVRSAVLCARILWTYSVAQRLFPADQHLEMARRAHEYLTQRFWDKEHGGVHWLLDRCGRPVNDRKHVYAQAFCIYSLAEHYRATQAADSLRLAQELFGLLETHACDRVHGGYVEGCGRAWDQLADMRLSDKEPDCRKSMNTLLHLMEAYANLARVWDSEKIRTALRGLVEVFLDHIIDPRSAHLRLFFDDEWRVLSGAASYGHEISYGHDIEASWLLSEAAAVLGEPQLLQQARAAALKIAAAVLAEGQHADGWLLSGPAGEDGAETDWWVVAEAVVGYYNAYQLSGQQRFAEAARSNWDFIEAKLVDRTHGDWFKRLDPSGAPDATMFKVGPWECPYHHSRCCFEMLARLHVGT